MTSLKTFTVDKGAEADEILRSARRVLMNEEMALKALGESLDAEFIKAIDLIEAAEGRVIVTGMGKSGHIGRKIAATMASTGTPAFFVHPGEASHGDLGMIVRGDVVIALSNSGEAKELNDLIAYTRRFAIPLIAVTSKAQSTLGTRSDVTLLLPPCPEACPNGLAPTTSTTMTLALGDALAVILLERKGFSEKDFRVFHPGGKLGQQLMAVKDIMHVGERLPLAPQEAVMQEILPIMTAKGFGMIGLVDDEGHLQGVITDGDIRRHISADFLSKKATALMNIKPVTVGAQALVGEVMGVMNDVQGSGRKITCLFVVDDAQKPVGIVHMHDCLKAGFI
jgi:arabinose-5-phosphate isomerase